MHDTALQYMIAQIYYGIEVILFLLLFASYYLTQEKNFDYHRRLIGWMVLLQSILVLNMFYSFFFTYYGGNFIFHAIIGTLVYLLILYTFFYMDNKLPNKLRIPKKYSKSLMRIAAVLWGIAMVSGLISLLVIVD